MTKDWRKRHPHLLPRSRNDVKRLDVKRAAKFLTSAPIDEVENSRAFDAAMDHNIETFGSVAARLRV